MLIYCSPIIVISSLNFSLLFNLLVIRSIISLISNELFFRTSSSTPLTVNSLLSLSYSKLDKAVQSVLDDGLRTKDIMSKNMKEVSTSDMGDAIIAKLK